MEIEQEPLIDSFNHQNGSVYSFYRMILSYILSIYYSGKIRDLVKALVAFALTSYLTFNHYSHEAIGYYSHMATVSILFFHPCKSIGGMFEAVIMGTIGLIVACLTTFLSYYFQFNDHIIIRPLFVISLIFSSTFILAYLRAKSSRPPVYTGTIISHLMIFTILTSDATGDLLFEKIKSVIYAVLAGIGISMLTNVVLWPSSATNILRQDSSNTILSMENLLSLLVSSFLLENDDPNGLDENILTRIEVAMDMHQNQFIKLTRSHAEAKLEFIRPFKSSSNWNALIASLNRLSRHLGGLKSSVLKLAKWDVLQRPKSSPHCDLELLRQLLNSLGPALKELASECSAVILDLENMLSKARFWFKNYDSQVSIRGEERLQILQRRLEDALFTFDTEQKIRILQLYDQKKYDGRPSDEVFLIYHFVFCIIEFCKELKTGFLPKVGSVCGLQIARPVNQQRRKTWLMSWFSNTSSENSYDTANETLLNQSDDDDEEEISPFDDRPKSQRFLHPQNSDCSTRETRGKKSSFRTNSRYFEYLQSQTNDAYHHYLKSPSTATLPSYTPARLDRPQTAPAPPVEISFFLRHRLRLWHFLSELRNSFNLKFALKTSLLVTAIASAAFIPFTCDLFHRYRMHWSMISVVVVMSPTVGGTNLAGLYRVLGTLVGSLYSFFINYLVHKVIQVEFETTGKWILYSLLLIFAIPFFYIFLFSKYPRVGQVTLVTVCSIALAQEANRFNPDWSISMGELALKRGIMVSAGILSGLIVNWYVWPFEARVELRKGLSDLLLNMGILYSRLVEIFSVSPSPVSDMIPTSGSKVKITVSTLHNFYYTRFNNMSPEDTYTYFLAFELKLHMALLRLDQLIPLTWLEPRLKGPFPVEVYRKIVKKCMLILDKFAAMRIAVGNQLHINSTTEKPQPNLGQFRQRSQTLPNLHVFNSDLILGPSQSTSKALPTSRKSKEDDEEAAHEQQIPNELLPYRKELVGSVLQSFYIYSSCLILKQPLPTYLPPMNEARRRLMSQLNLHMHQNAQKSTLNVNGRSVPLSIAVPGRFINFYAYSLAMEDVITELEELGVILKSLFGEMFADVVQIFPDDGDFGVSGEYDYREEGESERILSSPLKIHSKGGRKSHILGDDEEEDTVRWWRSSGHWML